MSTTLSLTIGAVSWLLLSSSANTEGDNVKVNKQISVKLFSLKMPPFFIFLVIRNNC